MPARLEGTIRLPGLRSDPTTSRTRFRPEAYQINRNRVETEVPEDPGTAELPEVLATTTIFDTPVVRTLARWISIALLRVLGWRLEGRPPDTREYVLVAAPHTSNWDLLVMLGMAFRYPIRLYWMGKHTLFGGPMGPVMKWMGGMPIDRRGAHNVVEQVVAQFAAVDDLILAVHPAGTRGWTEEWKTGFYYIALEAQVPISLGFIDYGRKVGGFGPALTPSGDIQADMALIREFYSGVTPKNPVRARPPRDD